MTSAAMGAAPSFPRFMDRLAQRQSPAVLWYSVPGERIELSGRVLNNWVAKTANLLVDECELEAGQCIVLPERLHWRSLVIALAALRVGAEISFKKQRQAQIFVTFDPEECSSYAEQVLVLASEPLALRYQGKLPAGAFDYAAEVRSHPDVYMGVSEPAPQLIAWEGTSYQALMQELENQAEPLTSRLGQEVAVLAIREENFEGDVLTRALTALGAGYAVLVFDPQATWGAERISRVLDDERAQPYPH